MEIKVVVHLKGGTIHKGITHDFSTAQEYFHLLPAEGGGVPVRVRRDDMKALFYVKDYIGNRDFVAHRAFAEDKPLQKAIVTFKDGEEIWGYVEGSSSDDEIGFFFYPADKRDNNIKIYVVRSATEGCRLV